ncbi:unnamed protein product [Brassica rapa subsp. trilocularis]
MQNKDLKHGLSSQCGPSKPQENLSHTHRGYDGQSARVVGLSIPNAAVETVLQGELFPYSFILTSWLFM